jgi:hypothetical protein
MIKLQTSVKQDDTTRTRTPKPGYLNLSINNNNTLIVEHIITTYKLICICMLLIYLRSIIS